MPRLLDDIRAVRRVAMPEFVARGKEDAWASYATRVMPMLANPGLPVLLVDNVADYYYQQTEQEYWDLTKDFPNIAPPFDQFWTEYKLPRMIHSKDKGDTDLSDLGMRGRAGFLVTAIPREKATGENIPPEAKWILWIDMWVDYGWGGGVSGPHGACFLAVDAQGRAIDRIWMQSFAAPQFEGLMKSIMAWFNPVFLAVSFLHCKNVALVDNRVDRPLAKKWAAKNGGLQPTSYKTLVIEPLKQILRTQGNADKHGLAKAMHICRGHFRDYTEGRGLFGKLHGQFWIPSVVRGTKGKKASPREIEVKV